MGTQKQKVKVGRVTMCTCGGGASVKQAGTFKTGVCFVGSDGR